VEVRLLDIKIWGFGHVVGDALLFQDVPICEKTGKRKHNGGHLSFLLPVVLLPFDQLNGL
jgi:hypothetical protein